MKRSHVLLIVCVWLAIHAILFYHPGLRYELFDSKTYRVIGANFIEHLTLSEASDIFYLLPIALIGLFDCFENGLVYFFIFQSLLSLLATFALYKTAERAYASQTAALCAAFIFLLWWDNIQWNTALMTESIACSLICLVFYFLSTFEKTVKHIVILVALLVACLLTRPTGVIIVVATICFFLYRSWPDLKKLPALKTGIVISIVSILATGAFVMFSIWDFTDQYMRGNIVTYMDSIEGLPLYDETLRLPADQLRHPDPTHKPMVKIIEFVYLNPWHFLKAATMKIFFLAFAIRPYYSALHNIALATMLLTIYAWSVIGSQVILNKDIKVLAIVTILINCLLIGISSVDWDNRFYIPMEPAVVILAAGGAAVMVGRFRQKLVTSKNGL